MYRLNVFNIAFAILISHYSTLYIILIIYNWFFQTANFATNKIVDTEGIEHPLLENLNLNCEYSSMLL